MTKSCAAALSLCLVLALTGGSLLQAICAVAAQGSPPPPKDRFGISNPRLNASVQYATASQPAKTTTSQPAKTTASVKQAKNKSVEIAHAISEQRSAAPRRPSKGGPALLEDFAEEPGQEFVPVQAGVPVTFELTDPSLGSFSEKPGGARTQRITVLTDSFGSARVIFNAGQQPHSGKYTVTACVPAYPLPPDTRNVCTTRPFDLEVTAGLPIKTLIGLNALGVVGGTVAKTTSGGKRSIDAAPPPDIIR
jgi:hypothetical protein